MRSRIVLAGLALFALPAAAFAQASTATTQTRSGMGNAAHPINPSNSLPSGSEDASTGPQGHPAYPSGSTTPNSGAAFENIQTKPAVGVAHGSPGAISTVTTHGGTTPMRPTRKAVGQEGAGRTTSGK